MANGTPSNTIPLGSDLLEAMGDVKGAMKALGAESKAAKADAREANKELKKAEKQATKSKEEIEKLRKSAFAKGEVATSKAVRFQRAKDEAKAEKDRIKGMNEFEARVNSRMMSVGDKLSSVSSKLSESSSPLLRNIGAELGTASVIAKSKQMAPLIKAGGGLLRGAGVIGAGVAGGLAVAGGAQKFINRNLEEIRIRGQISDTLTAGMNAFAGKTVTGAEAGRLAAGFKAQAAIARKQIASESLVTGAIGTRGTIAEVLGFSKDVAKREQQLGKIFLEDRLLAERFGENVADSLNIEKLGKSKGVRDIVQKEINQDIVRGVLTNITAAINPHNMGANSQLKPLVDLLYSASDEEAINTEARRQREERIKAIKAQIEQDQKELREDPQGASTRKQAAIRDQSLEAERIRRDSQIARF